MSRDVTNCEVVGSQSQALAQAAEYISGFCKCVQMDNKLWTVRVAAGEATDDRALHAGNNTPTKNSKRYMAIFGGQGQWYEECGLRAIGPNLPTT
jgi:hypothetical protein